MAKVLTAEERKAIETKANVSRISIGDMLAKSLTEAFKANPQWKNDENAKKNGIQFTIAELLPETGKTHISYTGSVELEKQLEKDTGLKVKRILGKVTTKNGKTDMRVIGFIAMFK